MEITNQTLFFYPFSGSNKQDLYSIIELFREMYPKEDELTIIMADTFGNDYYSRLLKFIHEIGFDHNYLHDVKHETIEYSPNTKQISIYENICKDYGWSTKDNFEMNRFKLQLKDDDKIEIDLIFSNMDAFNCFDFLKEKFMNRSIQGEMNLILKYPGLELNEKGFQVFSELGLNFKRLNKVFVCDENQMVQPEGYSFSGKTHSFNYFQCDLFDAFSSENEKKAKRVLRFV
jgi:hypothetical protein